jgi:Winged helix DNA-binding domain
VRTLSDRELNRALLARQLLLERRRLTVVKAVERLVALQAQYAPSPYVALWSRLDRFRKEQLNGALERGTVVKAGLLRSTLHVVSRADFPSVATAHVDSRRGRLERLGTDVEAVRAALPDRPLTAEEVREIARRVLRVDDRWTIAFTLRAIPMVRLPPVGPWPHHRPSPELVWREPLPPADAAAAFVVRRYLGAFGPGAREDVEHFTAFRVRQIEPALEDVRTFADERGRVLYDVRRGLLPDAATRAPVRFLPPYDSIILGHRDRSRIVPDEYVERVFRKANTTTLPTFTVDGFVAGAWRAGRKRDTATMTLEPFAPLPRAVHAEVDDEADRLVRWLESDATSFAVRRRA